MRRRFAAALALALLVPLPGLAGEVVVKSGETLSEIADRYGTTVNRLMEMNGLRNANDLWAGSRIKVPGNVYSGGGSGNYTVKPGETLSEIADRYGTTVNQLMRLNGLRDANDLWAGSRIQVPGASPRSSQAAVNRNASRHTVQDGETLSEIAGRYGVPMSRLVALNNLSSADQLMSGTTLQLRSTSKPKPKPKPAAPLAAKPKPKPAVTTAVAPKPQPKPAVEVAIKPEPKPEPKPEAQVVFQPQPKPEPKAEPKPTIAKAEPVKTEPAKTEVAKAEPVKAEPVKAEVAKPAPTQVASAKTKTTTTSKTNSKASTPDWRSYGPLQVDWANWQAMGGSFVAPSLNSDGQPLYLAINCNAKRLNATGQSGAWKTWDAPQSDFEQQLIEDLCKAKPG
ncbi:MAG: LysM peptidoglycan-binding domain-containing protein [Vulcanococcus sp.]